MYRNMYRHSHKQLPGHCTLYKYSYMSLSLTVYKKTYRLKCSLHIFKLKIIPCSSSTHWFYSIVWIILLIFYWTGDDQRACVRWQYETLDKNQNKLLTFWLWHFYSHAEFVNIICWYCLCGRCGFCAKLNIQMIYFAIVRMLENTNI